jgi:hypothetical protein
LQADCVRVCFFRSDFLTSGISVELKLVLEWRLTVGAFVLKFLAGLIGWVLLKFALPLSSGFGCMVL